MLKAKKDRKKTVGFFSVLEEEEGCMKSITGIEIHCDICVILSAL